MLLSIHHRTTYEYDPPTSSIAMLLRLWPAEGRGQRVQQWAVRVNDDPVTPGASTGYRGAEALWTARDKCDRVFIEAEGVVDTQDIAGVVGDGQENIANPRLFLRQTERTAPCADIADIASRAISYDGTLATLHALSALINQEIAYAPGTTEHDTTAAEAMARRSGVCQDQAHIFIAASRSLEIPARYVVGYMLAGPDAHETHETHGWVEAHVIGLGWVGFDPANGVCPTDHYVRLGVGLDAYDAAPVHGIVRASRDISVNANVAIAPVVAMTQQQGQQ